MIVNLCGGNCESETESIIDSVGARKIRLPSDEGPFLDQSILQSGSVVYITLKMADIRTRWVKYITAISTS